MRLRFSTRRRADAWPPRRPVRFVTSFNDVFWEASGRRCVETFRRQNPDYELRAYIEAGDEGALAAMDAQIAELGALPVRLAALPLLAEFLAIARDVIPQELGGDAPPEAFPGEGPQTGDVWFRKHMFRWFRKIVALDHAIAGWEDVLFWMDCDCFSKKPLTQPVLEGAFDGAGVIHMKADRTCSETGVVGYDLRVAGTRELIAAMKAHYLSRDFERYPRWDDCITLDLCLACPGAPVARDIATRAIRHGNVLPTTPLGRYLEHDKGLHSRTLGIVR